jgi:hypothetical protein
LLGVRYVPIPAYYWYDSNDRFGAIAALKVNLLYTRLVPITGISQIAT